MDSLMPSRDEQLCRRAVLDRLERAGAPITIADLLAFLDDRYGDRLIRLSIKWLESAGYARNAHVPAHPFFEITPAGRAQLTREAATLDVGLYGRDAL